jgi:hypothetical protein
VLLDGVPDPSNPGALLSAQVQGTAVTAAADTLVLLAVATVNVKAE